MVYLGHFSFESHDSALPERPTIWRGYALRPFDWRVLPIKLVHAGRLSDPVSRRDVYEQEQPGLW